MTTENINLQAGIAIGKILEARASKLYVRRKHVESFAGAEQELASAKSSYNSFGMYDDCGPSYEADLEQATAKFAMARSSVSLLISFEKHLKRLKHEFNEQYPEYLPILEAELNAQTIRIQAENKQRGSK